MGDDTEFEEIIEEHFFLICCLIFLACFLILFFTFGILSWLKICKTCHRTATPTSGLEIRPESSLPVISRPIIVQQISCHLPEDCFGVQKECSFCDRFRDTSYTTSTVPSTSSIVPNTANTKQPNYVNVVLNPHK